MAADEQLNCCRCGQPATRRLSPDLDMRGVAVCDACEKFIICAVMTDDEALRSNLLQRPTDGQKGHEA